MMNYELFKEVVAEKILDYMPQKYQKSRIDISPVPKINQTLDGLNIIPADESIEKVSPTMYINNMYDKYLESNDLNQVLRDSASSLEKAFDNVPDTTHMLDFDSANDNIIMQLVNTEQNQEILINMPHREFQDLSIIYRWLVDQDREGISSTMVNSQDDFIIHVEFGEEAETNAENK